MNSYISFNLLTFTHQDPYLFSSMASSLQFETTLFKKSVKLGVWNTQFELGSVRFAPNQKPMSCLRVRAQAGYCVSKSMRWWEKTMVSNMIEVQSGQELVDVLNNAGEKLVVVDFYSPGCGACKALHPKLCQLAELNPGAIFLKVNQEELRKMCNCLNIHVLPFFRFYKGAKGQVCSFSCTVSTIKKFKDALAKYGLEQEQQSGAVAGLAKGLSESEMFNLASVGEIKMPLLGGDEKEKEMEKLFMEAIQIQTTSPMSILGAKEDSFMVAA